MCARVGLGWGGGGCHWELLVLLLGHLSYSKVCTCKACLRGDVRVVSRVLQDWSQQATATNTEEKEKQ